jgi:hypothetical protein
LSLLGIVLTARGLHAQQSPRIDTGSLPDGTVGVNYNQVLAASRGTPPYVWSQSAGSLPAGLNLAANGTISGTPASAGKATFTVRVTDSSSQKRTDTQQLSITIVNPPLTITTDSLPGAIVGTPYSQTLSATGGTAPYTWSRQSGSLPSGMTLSSDGIISGTPAGTGTFSFAARVADRSSPSQNASKTFTVVVTALPALTITTAALASGTVGSPYSQRLAATGGAPPYVWSLSSGSLPNGLGLSSSGEISGVPTAPGTATFETRVADAASPAHVTIRNFAIVIANSVPSAIPNLSLTGIPNAANPTQQIQVAAELAAPYAAPLSGTLTASFIPTTTPVDDPMVRFSTGTRTANFTIPANAMRAVFASPVFLLTGTVSGVVNLTASIQDGPTGVLIGSVLVRPLPPQITNVSAVRKSGALEIQATGYSTERRINAVEFGFDVKTADGVTRVNLSRNVQAEFDNWYRNPTSAGFGSAFVFTQSFYIQGDPNSVQSVTISLTNEQGRTSSLPVQITN